MLFKRKFFLDLSGGGAEPQPALVAPVRPSAPEEGEPAPEAATSAPVLLVKAPAVAAGAPAPLPAPEAVAPEAPAPALTTVEAIAAELAAAQAERPAPSLVTFAPDCVTAGGAVPMRRRRAGANLAGFKAMARGMMKS
jgi:hypothetical protein